MSERPQVIIYTDGGALGNPGPGGYGVVMLYNQHRKELSGGYRRTTNNRMELMAAISALEKLKTPCDVTLYTDSRYVADSINLGWAKRWRANGWRKNKNVGQGPCRQPRERALRRAVRGGRAPARPAGRRGVRARQSQARSQQELDELMEYFLAIAAGSGPARKERFAELGAALERAVALLESGAATPLELTDTGERRLLGQAEIERLARLAGKFAPADDDVARQVFAPLSDATLDNLCRWLIFRMRSAGVSPRVRLALIGSVLDAISPDA